MVLIKVGKELVKFPDDMSQRDIEAALSGQSTQIAQEEAPQQQTVIGSPPSGDAPLGTLPDDIQTRSSFNPKIQGGLDILKQSIKEVPEQLSIGLMEGIEGLAHLVNLGGEMTKTVPLPKAKTSAGKVSNVIGRYAPVVSQPLGITNYLPPAGILTPGQIKFSQRLDKVKKPLVKVADPVLKSRAAREGIKVINNTKKELGHLVNKTKNELDWMTFRAKQKFGEVAKKTSDSIDEFVVKKDNIIKSFTKEKSRNIKGLEDGVTAKAGDLEKGISNMDDYILKSKKALQNNLDDAEQVVKAKFNEEYNHILKTDLGDEIVDISESVDRMSVALKVPSTASDTAGNKMVKVIKQLEPNVDDAGKATLDTMLKAIEESPDLTVRQAHWFKQSINEVSDSLYRNAGSKDEALALRGVVDGLVKSIDEVIEVASPETGKLYGNVSGRYSSFLKKKRLIDSGIGKVEEFGGKQIRTGTKQLFSDIDKAAREGVDITDDLFIAQENKIRNLYRQRDLLRENGFTEIADSVDDQVTSLYKNIYKKKNMEDGYKFLKQESKSNPELKKALSGSKASDVNNIEESIGALQKTKVRLKATRDEIVNLAKKRRLALRGGEIESVNALDNQIAALQSQITNDTSGLSIVALNIVGRSISRFPGLGFLRGAVDAVTAIEGTVKYKALAASSGIDFINMVERVVIKASSSIRDPKIAAYYATILKGIGRVASSMSGSDGPEKERAEQYRNQQTNEQQ